MNLTTQVSPISLSRWLCEVFIIGGHRVAYAETPKETELTRTSAIYFVEAMAHLCSFFVPGKYNVYGKQSSSFLPMLIAETDEQPELEKIGEADLPRQEREVA